MQSLRRLSLTAAVFALLSAQAPPSRAGDVGTEVWLAGGFVDADYGEDVLACLRGGVGFEFLGRFGVGLNAQVDRAREFYFAYASVVLPAIGLVEPYARFHVGRRDDLDDTALGWTGGLQLGDGNANFFIEAHGVLEPGYANGASIGFSF